MTVKLAGDRATPPACRPAGARQRGWSRSRQLFGSLGDRGLGLVGKRVADNFDRRPQGIDPILAVAAMNILFAVAEQIALNIPVDGWATSAVTIRGSASGI